MVEPWERPTPQDWTTTFGEDRSDEERAVIEWYIGPAELVLLALLDIESLDDIPDDIKTRKMAVAATMQIIRYCMVALPASDKAATGRRSVTIGSFSYSMRDTAETLTVLSRTPTGLLFLDKLIERVGAASDGGLAMLITTSRVFDDPLAKDAVGTWRWSDDGWYGRPPYPSMHDPSAVDYGV